MANIGTLQVVQSFFATLDGQNVSFRKGELINGDHPAVRKWPDNFGPLTIPRRSSDRIEQATAAPGEKRGA